MKKKIKQLVKGILTVTLVVTMFFGQLPTGLVMVANAAPAENILGVEEKSSEQSSDTVSQEKAMEISSEGEKSSQNESEVLLDESEQKTVEQNSSENTVVEESAKTENGFGLETAGALRSLQGALLKAAANTLLGVGNDNPPGNDNDGEEDGEDPEIPETIGLTLEFSTTIKSGETYTFNGETPFTLSGVEEGDRVGVTYNSSYNFAEKEPGNYVKSSDFSTDQFELTGEDRDKYSIASFNIEIKVEPNSLENIDLTSGNSVQIGEDTISFNSGTTDDKNVYWYNTTELKCNEVTFYSYDSEQNSVSSIGSTITMEEGKDKEQSNIVLEYNGIFYGSVSIKYNCDVTSPNFLLGEFNYTSTSGGPISIIETSKMKITEDGSGVSKVQVGESETEYDLSDLSIADKSITWKENSIPVQTGKYYYFYIEDYAGNKAAGKFDSTLLNDHTAPVIESIVPTFTASSHYPYLSSLSFQISASDEDGGLKDVKIDLYDGKDTPVLYETWTPNISDEDKNNWTSEDIECTSYFGYQLHFAITLTDRSGNQNFYSVYYSDGSMNYGEPVASAEEAKSSNNTFAILGKGDNAPSVSIESNDSYEVNNNMYVYFAEKRDVSVKINKMALESISFVANAESVNDGSVNNSTVTFESTGYDATKHCYLFGNNTYLTFSRKKEGVAYKTFYIKKGGLSTIIGFEIDNWNKEFRLDESSDVEVVVDLSPSTDSIHGNFYYDSDVTATIKVSGYNLAKPLNYFQKNLDKYMESNSDDLTIATLSSLTWEAAQDNDGKDIYSAKYTFEKDLLVDKEYKINLRAKKSQYNSNWGKAVEKSFVFDTITPTVAISYEGETKYYQTDEGEEYFYGLIGGDGDPSELKATINVTEANFFKDDFNVYVKKDSGVYEKLGFDTQNPYGITLESGITENQPNNTGNRCDVTVTIPGKADHSNDGAYTLKVIYKDPIGHSMEAEDASGSYAVTNGVYEGTERKDTIDTSRPKVTLSIKDYLSEKDASFKSGYKDDAKDYYKNSFVVNYKLSSETSDSKEENYDKALFSAQESSSVVDMELNETEQSYSATVTKDGEYQFTINGTDKAGNLPIICKGAGATDEDLDAESFKLSGDPYETAVKVLDRVAPVAKLSITPNTPKEIDINKDYNRFFFNTKFDAELIVNDKYMDTEKSFTVKYGANNGPFDAAKDEDNLATATVTADEIISDFSSNPEEFRYTYTGEADGLYILTISGEDKAGNEIVMSTDDDDSKKYFSGKSSGGVISSHIFVVDQTAPKLDMLIDDGTIFKGTLSKDGFSIENNYPYQKKNSATIKLEGIDCSPVKISYETVSTIGAGNITGHSDFKKNVSQTVGMNGAQIFEVEQLVIEDLAGNIVRMKNPSNKFYLDVTPPKDDKLAPTTQIVSKVPSAGRGPAGNDLYKSNVTVVAVVQDNSGEAETKLDDKSVKVSATGIYKVYYQIVVNEVDVTDSSYVKSKNGGDISKASDGEGYYVTYKTGGPDYNNQDAEEDQALTNLDELTFSIPANDTFNYNNIIIRVWAMDNAGNKLDKTNASVYKFGIDTTSPSISVSYDNNSAQNGKYFKANRTATVVVQERNFDPGRTGITTQANAHIGGWSYQRGNKANGDEDRWIASVVYDTDGDYTFDAYTTDVVGHSASGVNYGDSVAPTNFTIDKTIPTIIVSFDNNNVQNGRYYNANRRATIDITEHNFDAKDTNVERTATIAEGTVAIPGVGPWTRINDVNRSEVYFGQDGDYTMKVDFADLAGNPAETYMVDLFTIDTVAPTLEISGVENKHAYNGNVAPTISYHDINYDKNSAEVKITGYKHTSGSNLKGTRTDETFGGRFACDNIEELRENDDVYTAVGRVKDLAGNETSDEVTFSVNRFGSTYILNDETKDLVDRYYSNTEHALGITEINVNELSKNEVTYSLNGDLVTLSKGADYTIKSENPGWWQYDYTIDASNFEKEGNYVVTLTSVDEATNVNTTRAIRENKGPSSELDISFMIDKTAPSLIITGVEDNGRYSDNERTIVVHYEDNSFVNTLNVYANNQLVKQLDAKSLSEAKGQIEYVASSKSTKQSVRVEAVDAAGNEGNTEISKFLISKNILVQFVNNTPLLIAVIAGLLLLTGGIFFIILAKRRKKEQYY